VSNRNFSAKAIGIATAATILAACSNGAQSSLNPPGLTPSSSSHLAALVPRSGAVRALPVAGHRTPGRSWMTPDKKKKKKALLYVSNFSGDTVSVYSYPAGELVGSLTGFDGPDDICNGKGGDVWITNQNATDLVEYAHGGTSPKATLSDPGEYPVGCSVDPRTGNLAVGNILSTGDSPGSVAVYKNARGTPTLYEDTSIPLVLYVGYDNDSNLYIDGLGSSGQFQFAELAKGSSSITNITLSGGTVTSPGNIRWDGKYVAVGDQEYQGQDASEIYQTTGSGGKIVGTTVLGSAEDVAGFCIWKGKVAIAPDAGLNDVFFYKYPAGGAPTKTLTGFDGSFGTAISP
jgi:hypothetical protein